MLRFWMALIAEKSGKVETAIQNDSAVCEEDNDVPALNRTEFFRLGKEILAFVKEVVE